MKRHTRLGHVQGGERTRPVTRRPTHQARDQEGDALSSGRGGARARAVFTKVFVLGLVTRRGTRRAGNAKVAATLWLHCNGASAAHLTDRTTMADYDNSGGEIVWLAWGKGRPARLAWGVSWRWLEGEVS